tara:strand:+ start:48359 stop:49840 length:1482 start_codon:yes stop_codon:yes gene_type:complete
MQLTEEQVRLIFGLKLKQIRTEKDLSLFGLSKLTGLSKSYLNEIEKGKKYPKPDKVVAIAEALETPYDEMVSMKLSGSMAPLSDIIKSGILKEIPLELFGIEENNLIDIIANAPEKVMAFISTLFEISRHYDVTRENFYLASLRSYQESHENYFPEIEKEVTVFAKRYQVDLSRKIESSYLEEILAQEFGYTIDYETLSDEDYPGEIRSVFIPKKKKLLIANSVSEAQRVFILAKELGYAHMKIEQRPLTFTWIKFEHFEDVLNNFKASYFAGALILPEARLVDDLKAFFKNKTWNPEAFLEMLLSYTDSAETFFQRLTNVLPGQMGIPEIFFLRFSHDESSEFPYLTKELHLSRNHQPHSIKNKEHYCLKWISTDILINKKNYVEKDNVLTGIQHSNYPDSGDQYLILSASNFDPFKSGKRRSVCIGIDLNGKQKKKIAFSEEAVIQRKDVGVTCERCSIKDCDKRVARPEVILQQQKNNSIEEKVYKLINE